jgi:hypothetical protein
MLSGIAGQKSKGGRENGIIAEGRTANEAERGEEGKRKQQPFFMLVKAGRDELPNIIKYDRTGEKYASDKGKFQIKKNPSW